MQVIKELTKDIQDHVDWCIDNNLAKYIYERYRIASRIQQINGRIVVTLTDMHTNIPVFLWN